MLSFYKAVCNNNLWYPVVESNHYLKVRSFISYPLNERGIRWVARCRTLRYWRTEYSLIATSMAALRNPLYQVIPDCHQFLLLNWTPYLLISFGDSGGSRTHDSGFADRCLSLLTTESPKDTRKKRCAITPKNIMVISEARPNIYKITL